MLLQALVDDANACRRKMNMATALIDGLSGEKTRWTAASKGFEAQINRLVGDVLLATGFLSYAGPFNQEFRKQLMKNWKKEMTQNHIPFSEVQATAETANRRNKDDFSVTMSQNKSQPVTVAVFFVFHSYVEGLFEENFNKKYARRHPSFPLVELLTVKSL